MRPLLSRSLSRKLLVAAVAVAGLMLAYEVSTSDSQEVAPEGLAHPSDPVESARLEFEATAYCKGTTTAAGIGVRRGIAAADRALLPLGSIVSVTAADEEYSGIYTILDTGPAVRGRVIDLYMWSCNEALAFGRQQVGVTILRLGWDPAISSPSLIDAEFARREAERRSAAPAPTPESDDSPDSEAGGTLPPAP